MKSTAFIGLLISALGVVAQRQWPVHENKKQRDVPLFKQVTHPFMPAITSEYFYFTEDGLTWFSTARGLTSFDGSEVVYYSTLEQASTLGLTRINTMAEDRQHNLYVAGLFGLVCFNRKNKSFTPLPYTFPDTHKQSNIVFRAFYFDKDGTLYAGSASKGLFVYNPNDKKFSHYNMDVSKPDSWKDRGLNTVSCFAKHATDSDKLWVGTFNGIYLLDKKTQTFDRRFEILNPRPRAFRESELLEPFDVQKMDVADDSTLWFNSWTQGFGKYNTRTGKARLFLHHAKLKTAKRYIGYIMPRFARLSPGKYLLGIYDGKSAVFDTRTESVTYFNVSRRPYEEEQTRFVTNDRRGNLWMLQRGFLYAAIPDSLRLQSVEVASKAVGIHNPEVIGLYFDTAARLYYAAFFHSGAGVQVLDSNFHKVTVLPTPLITNYFAHDATVNSKITKDGSGRWWTAGWENYVLLPGKESFEPVERIFPALGWLKEKGECIDVTTDNDGNILLKNENGTVYRIHHRTQETDTIRPPEIKADGVEIKDPTIWHDEKRAVIYLTCTSGMAQYDLNNHKMIVIPHQSLFGSLPPDEGVCVSTLDAEGRIWFLIPKYGIRIIHPGTLTCTDSIPFGVRGLMRGDYTSLLGGLEPYMLFRSQNGIAVYDYRKRYSFLFDHSNGLSSPDTKSFLYCNGYLIVGQSGSFEYFKLATLNNYSSRIIPYVNTIVAGTAMVFTRSGANDPVAVQLPHHQNTLSFSFSAPEYLFPERIEYAYQLRGIDKGWQYTNSFNRKITYSGLSPGRYTFQLKAQMTGGDWQTVPVEYTVNISPAWWQTLPFTLFCLLAAAGFVFYFIRKRIQYVRRKEQQKVQHEKELLTLEAKALRAQMNPHFIFNCLNSIKALIQKNENDTAAAYLTTFSKLIRILFQNSDKREVSLYEEIETCKLYAQLEAVRFADKVSFHFVVDESIDLKDIKVPALILQPFIENAIWHGLVPKEEGGRVEVSVQQDNGSVCCIIDDNGIGRDLSRQYKSAYADVHQSKGISLTQSRLRLDKLLNGRDDSIDVIDKKEPDGRTGTTIVLTFKNSKE